MKKILLPLALMSALLVSCEKPENGEDNPDPEYSISISPTELTFGAEGGEQIVTVTSSDDWYLDGENYWCEVSASYGESGDEILIVVNPNAAEYSRTAKLVFTCGDKTAELTINQQKDEIIEFKDPAFLQSVLQDPWVDADKNGDKKISKAEAALVSKLHIRQQRIRVLDEIKYFIALTGLYCMGNQLTSLDLSKNTALTYLECYGNQLTSLDLSKNTALTYLECFDNQLTSLDLSKNTALESLKCDNNQLTSLDLSKNTALEYLNCYNNQLTSLDLSKNTALTYLECFDNQLTSLDLSKNTALESLKCGNNQLTSLDLSKNTALTVLTCSDNPLQKLILYKYHIIGDYYMEIIEGYVDIIEYVE